MAALKRSRETEDLETPRKKKKCYDRKENTFQKVLNLLTKPDTLSAGLTLFWKELSEYNGNDIISSYILAHPECNHVMESLELSTKGQSQDEILICLLLLEQIFLFTAVVDSETTQLTDDNKLYQSIGSRLATSLLSSHLGSIYFSLSPNKPDILCAAALRLLTAVVMQGPATATEFLVLFDFGLSSLNALPHRHKKYKDTEDSVRVCFIKFALAFLIVGDSNIISEAIQKKKFMTILFRGLSKDPPEITELFLSTIHDKVVLNKYIAKKTKILLFSKFNLNYLVQLLCDSNYHEDTIKEIVYEILYTLGSDIKYGICFLSSTFLSNTDKINNPVLLHLAFRLCSFLEQLRVRKLITSMISTSPDILMPFLKGASLDLEPKLSQKWMWNMELVLSILSSLPHIYNLTIQCHLEDNITSVPITTLLSYCCPPILTRLILSNGIQNSCLVVQDLCLRVIVVVLERGIKLQNNLKDDVQRLLCDSLLRLLPDVKTMMLVRHGTIKLCNGNHTPKTTIPSDQVDLLARNEDISRCPFLVLNRIMHTVCLYQRLSPIILSQSHINISKLLTDIYHYDGGLVSSQAERISEVEHEVLVNILAILSEAPLDSLQNILKGDLVQCLLHLTKREQFQEQIINFFVKCLRLLPCLLDFERDLLVIFHIISSHLSSSLYSNKETLVIIEYIQVTITSLSKDSIKWFAFEDSTNTSEDTKNSNPMIQRKNILLCPLLVSLLNNFNKYPLSSCLLLISELITKLIHSSIESVSTAQLILLVIEQERLSTSCTNSSCQNYLQLLLCHLKVWSGVDDRNCMLSIWSDDQIVKQMEKLDDDTTVKREFLTEVLPLCSSKVLSKLLSNEDLHQLILSMLDTMYLVGLDNVPMKVLNQLPYSVIWQQCLLSISLFDNSSQKKWTISDINEVLASKLSDVLDNNVTSYQRCLICYQVLSVLRVLSSTRKDEFEDFMPIRVEFCYRLLTDVMVQTSSYDQESLTFIANVLDHIPLAKKVCHSLSPTDTIISVCTSISSEWLDKLMLSIFSAQNNTMETDTRVSPSLKVLPLANYLIAQSAENPHLQYSCSMFQELHDMAAATAQPRSLSHAVPLSEESSQELLKYCASVVTLTRTNLILILLELFPGTIQSSLTHLVPWIENCAVNFHLLNSSVFLSVVQSVLQKLSAIQRLGYQLDGNILNDFINSAKPLFYTIILKDDTAEDFSTICSDIIELSASLLPLKVERLLRRLLYRLMKKINKVKKMTNFQVDMIASLSQFVVSENVDLLLLAMNILLKNLRKLLKRKDKNCLNETSLIKALHKILKNQFLCTSCVEISNFEDVFTNWNKFILTSIKTCFHSSSLMNLLGDFMPFIYNKEREDVTAGKNVVSPDDIYKQIWLTADYLTLIKSTEQTALKSALVKFLVATAEYVTESSFSSDHIAVLLGGYTATLSPQDTGILYLLWFYEKAGILLAKFSPFVWGPKAVDLYKANQDKSWLLWKQPTAQEVLALIEDKKLALSISLFPYSKQLEPSSPLKMNAMLATDAQEVYDPSFLLPLFSNLLQSTSIFNCQRFISSGCLSYIITATSSLCDEMRRAAYHSLSLFNEHLTAAKFKEKYQFVIFLEILRNSIVKDNMRLPVVLSSLFAKAALIFIHTEHSLFPLVADKFVEKPFIDVRGVPFCDSMLESPRLEERHWMLQLLCDGIKIDSDYNIYRRNNILPCLMVLYQSPFIDSKSKSIIMKLLSDATSNHLVSQDYTWNYNFLSWIHSLSGSDTTVLIQLVLKLFESETDTKSSLSQPVTGTTHKAPYFEEDIALTSLNLINSLSCNAFHFN